MLIRSQVINMIKGRYDSGSLFSQLPPEIIRRIKYSPIPDQDFLDALKHTADGTLEELRAKLDVNPRLLLQAGSVVTPAGILVCDTTILECAIGAGEDKEMIEMIKSYFSKLPGGKEAIESQLARYRPCIEELQNQKPDDLTWLIDIVKNSSLRDVAAELATGDEYDETYQSLLRDALNQFRKEKLDPKYRVITKPQMHCNYQNLVHAFDIRDREWDNLKEGNNYDRIYLVEQQIIGFIELVELPAYERYVFARGQAEQAIEGKGIERSLKYKYSGGEFPCYDAANIDSHVGVGFDSVISIYGGGARGRGAVEGVWRPGFYKTYVEEKIQTCRTCAVTATPTISNHAGVYFFDVKLVQAGCISSRLLVPANINKSLQKLLVLPSI